MPDQSYQGTHRHRAPLGWHPPRSEQHAGDADRDKRLSESTQPFAPTFTGELPVEPDADTSPTGEPALNGEAHAPTPAAPGLPASAGDHQYLKRWTFVLVVAAVWVVSAAIGVGLYYWWFHSIDKTLPVFVVLIYVVVATVGSLIAAMVQDKPMVSALSVALMSSPLAAVGGAAVLHGTYFCDHVARCLMGVLPY